MINKAWECPRCNKINSPYNPQCFCSNQDNNSKVVKAAILPKICNVSDHVFDSNNKCIACLVRKEDVFYGCHHVWESTNNPANLIEKTCVKCGVNARDVPCVGGWL